MFLKTIANSAEKSLKVTDSKKHNRFFKKTNKESSFLNHFINQFQHQQQVKSQPGTTLTLPLIA